MSNPVPKAQVKALLGIYQGEKDVYQNVITKIL